MDRSYPAELESIPFSGKLLDKHRGIILIFMYRAERAVASSTLTWQDQLALKIYAQHGAWNFLQKVYDLDIRGTSIRCYYEKVKENATMTGFLWDQDTVARIIRSQVKGQDTYDEVTSFLAKHCQDASLFSGTNWLMKMALEAANTADFRSYGVSETQDRPKIKDPDLKQSFEETWTNAEQDIKEDIDKTNDMAKLALMKSPPGH